ncbi:MAG: saccharopine dehydrogenase NADP-binding domain-containing protein [bacterium]
MRVKILGGAGAVGTAVARDLLRSRAVEQVVIADIREEAARLAARSLADERAGWERLDVNDAASLRKVVDGRALIANCIGPHYRYARRIAEAAIEAGANACDICDDYDAAEAVLGLDARARQAQVTLITCLGTSPGVTNMLAKRGSEQLDETEEIHTYWAVGGSDPTGPSEVYHLAHICSGTVPQFLEGELKQVPALSGAKGVKFPDPVGKLSISYIGHSEPVTLSRFIPGVKTVTNRGGLFPQELNELVRVMRDIGLFSDSSLTVKGTELAPRDYTAVHIRHVLENSPDALGLGNVEGISVFRVEAIGKRQGKWTKVTYSGTNEVVTTTARSLSIGVQMLGEGKVAGKGVLAPEACLATGEFFARLAVDGGITLAEEIRSRSRLIG